MRVRLLRLHEVRTLICGGIKSFYRDQLSAMGIKVVPGVNDSIPNTVDKFLTGGLFSGGDIEDKSQRNDIVSHDDLVSWAKELFSDSGYSLYSCSEQDSLLIDLIAEIRCPVCNKKIEVAICCGAQMYRPDQEIREFYYTAKSRYNARVYVYLTDPRIEKSCNDYGIEFISPETTKSGRNDASKSRIPILQIPIDGHAKAFECAETGEL